MLKSIGLMLTLLTAACTNTSDSTGVDQCLHTPGCVSTAPRNTNDAPHVQAAQPLGPDGAPPRS
jgi:hypothetical protein